MPGRLIPPRSSARRPVRRTGRMARPKAMPPRCGNAPLSKALGEGPHDHVVSHRYKLRESIAWRSAPLPGSAIALDPRIERDS